MREEILMGFNVNALGFGDNVVDKYEHLQIMYPGGNAVNFAVFAKKCGATRAAYMGIFGNDAEAEHVIESLEQEQIELAKCKQVIGENGAARVTVIEGDRVFLGSNEGGIRGDMRYVLDRFDLEYIRQFDLVHSGNYCFTERELPKIREAGVPISFDFSDDSTEEYYDQIAPLVDYAFLSAPDGATEDEIKEILMAVAKRGPKFVSATRGAEGCIATDGERFYIQGSKPVEKLADTMAAGDSFLTSFLMHYLDSAKRGEDGSAAIEAALDFAAGFAAQVCGIDGSWGHAKRYV